MNSRKYILKVALILLEAFFSPKCTAFGGRAPPGPAGGAYSAPPDPIAGLRGVYFHSAISKGRRWEGRGGSGKKRRGREGEI